MLIFLIISERMNYANVYFNELNTFSVAATDKPNTTSTNHEAAESNKTALPTEASKPSETAAAKPAIVAAKSSDQAAAPTEKASDLASKAVVSSVAADTASKAANQEVASEPEAAKPVEAAVEPKPSIKENTHNEEW